MIDLSDSFFNAAVWFVHSIFVIIPYKITRWGLIERYKEMEGGISFNRKALDYVVSPIGALVLSFAYVFICITGDNAKDDGIDYNKLTTIFIVIMISTVAGVNSAHKKSKK